MTLPLMRADRHCRLLGALIASRKETGYIWTVTMQQLRAAMHLAAIKTTDVRQRVRLAKAVILPKILFVARHAWPSALQITTLQRFVHGYVWLGTLEGGGRRVKAWLSAEAAQAPVKDGGIGMPDVHAALLTMSVRTVQRWLHAGTNFSAAVGSVLLRPAASAPQFRPCVLSRTELSAHRLHHTLAATGLAGLRCQLALPRSPPEADMLAPLVAIAHRGRLSRKTWVADWLHGDYQRWGDQLHTLARFQRRRYGVFCLPSFLELPVTGAGFFITATGALHRQAFAALIPPAAKVRDVVEIRWTGHFSVAFRCRSLEYPLAPKRADLFRRFCDLLVAQYPELLFPQNPSDVMQPRPPTEARWFLTRNSGSIQLWVENQGTTRTCLGAISSSRTAAAAARLAGHAVLRFDPHPWLDAAAPLWHTPPPTVRSTSDAVHCKGSQVIRDRLAQAREHDAPIAHALDALSWNRIATLPHSMSHQRLLLFKLKGNRLSGWVRARGERGCPHCPDAGAATIHAFHMLWRCPAAHSMWTDVLAFWQHLGLWRDVRSPSDTVFLNAVFRLVLSTSPRGAWAFIATPAKRDPRVVDDLHGLLQHVWTLQVLACFGSIWAWRQGHQDAEDPWPRAAAVAHYRSRFVGSLLTLASTLDPTRPSTTGLRWFLVHCRHLVVAAAGPVPVTPAVSAFYVLFFDGGSRGKPGPGGAGAVILRVDGHLASATLLWSAAVSLAAQSTTNNKAEYVGLCTGLTAAHRHNWTPLQVVGDSALILGQLCASWPPRKETLRPLYATAHGLATQLGVERWIHHLRAYNKMADCAANVAMDTRRSIHSFHPSERLEWAKLPRLLDGDFQHWLASASGPDSVG